jgi:hypothetical protein
MNKTLAAVFLSITCTSSFSGERENLGNYQNPEPRLLQIYPHIFSRKDQTLTVNLRNGSSKAFTNVVAKKPQDDGGEYWLDAYYPDIHYALIRSSYWLGEGQSYDLLDLRSGNTFDVGGYPTLSPDKTRFAVEMEDISAGYFENLLAVYKITPQDLVLEFKLNPQEWGVADIRWQNSLRLTFNKKTWGPANELVVQKKILLGKKTLTGKTTWSIQ